MARYDVQKISSRLHALIEEGEAVAALERQSPGSSLIYIQGKDKVRAQAWLSNVLNILDATFGPSSPQYRHLRELMPDGPRHIEHSHEVYQIVGLLAGALSDLEGGFLRDQEQLIAAELFDSVLDQANELNRQGYKDPSAVLMRVVLEDSLRRLARKHGLDDANKAASINADLKKESIYAQPLWRQIQTWLDIGNAAAHGRFDEYSQDDVSNSISGVEQFVIAFFS